VLALALALPIAVWSAYRADGWFDRSSTTTSFALISVPNFALGVLLLYFLAVRSQVFPARYLDDTLLDRVRSMFLPALTLALPAAATYMRLLRTDLIKTLQDDFITTARAKGLPSWRILLRHALRPSSFSPTPATSGYWPVTSSRLRLSTKASPLRTYVSARTPSHLNS